MNRSVITSALLSIGLLASPTPATQDPTIGSITERLAPNDAPIESITAYLVPVMVRIAESAKTAP